MQKPALNTILFLGAIILSLLLHATGAHAYIQGKVEPIGEFTNMRYTEEHAYGYTVQLWREGDKVFGFLFASEGLAGDTPSGLLEDVDYDVATHRLTFRARLTLGQFYDKTHNGVPSRDEFRFNGFLRKDRIKGTIEAIDRLTPNATPRREEIVLTRSKEESDLMQWYNGFQAWRRDAEEILMRRGPKW